MIEGPDEILAPAVVDPGLAPDAGIHLAQQRRGHLDEADSPLIEAGGETGHIPDHPAPQGDQERTAVEAGLKESVQDLKHRLHALVLLPVGELDHLHQRRLQLLQDPLQMQRSDGGVGNDGHFALIFQFRQFVDDDIVTFDGRLSDLDGDDHLGTLSGGLNDRYFSGKLV